MFCEKKFKSKKRKKAKKSKIYFLHQHITESNVCCQLNNELKSCKKNEMTHLKVFAMMNHHKNKKIT
jgi:hypothetical protein